MPPSTGPAARLLRAANVGQSWGMGLEPRPVEVHSTSEPGRDSETQHPLETAGAGAEAALAGRVRYPEPAYHVERGYQELQTQEAPASSSTILPSQERYRGVWCARAFLAELVFKLWTLLTERCLQGRPRTVAYWPRRTGAHGCDMPPTGERVKRQHPFRQSAAPPCPPRPQEALTRLRRTTSRARGCAFAPAASYLHSKTRLEAGVHHSRDPPTGLWPGRGDAPAE